MTNKLVEKIESDALAAIDAIDAEYDKQLAIAEIEQRLRYLRDLGLDVDAREGGEVENG